MSMNDYNARALIFDLETAAIDGAAEFIEEPEPPSNYVKAEAIAAYVQKAKAKAIDLCSLDPDLARIVALGWLLEGEAVPIIRTCRNEPEERLALRAFWKATEAGMGTRRLVTFYGLSFDLPVLIRRSQYLGVPYPTLSLDRYRTPHVDLHAKLTFNGVIKSHKLGFYVKRFKLAFDDDPVTGAGIAALVREGSDVSWLMVQNHCTQDVLKTAALACRLGYLGMPAVAEEAVAL